MEKYRKLFDTPCEQWKIERVIGLDWNDGWIEGFCFLCHPQCEFYFQLLSYESVGTTSRLFTAYSIPPHTLEKLCGYLPKEEPDFLAIDNDDAWKIVEEIKGEMQPLFLFESRSLEVISKKWILTQIKLSLMNE
jgi:hypothetical protein